MLSMVRIIFFLLLSVAHALPMAVPDRLEQLEQQVKVLELGQQVEALAKKMLKDATTFNKPQSNWAVSSVNDMKHMFKDAAAFQGP